MNNKLKMNYLSVNKETEMSTKDMDESEDPEADTHSVRTEINFDQMKSEFTYYNILRTVLYPFILSGAPISYCLKDPDKTMTTLSRYGIVKVYSFIIVSFVHLICGFWLCRVFYHIFETGVLNDLLWDEIFTFLYSFSGVLALDMMWLYRNSLRLLILNLDNTPELDQTILMHYKYFKLKYKSRLTFLTLFVLSLLVLCLSYIAVVIVVAFNTESGTHWADSTFSFIALYSLYVVLFVMVLFIAFCWIMKFKFEHLNFYIQTLKKRKVKPDIKQLEIIKIWYRENLNSVKKIDEIFNIFIFGYFVLLFFGIVVEIEDVLALFDDSNKSIQEVLLNTAFIGLMIFSLFYTIKQTSDVTDDSEQTKSLLYDYVLSTDPEDRTAIYYEELQLMIPGLLANSANFTLLGLVNLNKDFMAHSLVFIYTYTLLFKQFVSDSNIQIKNITNFLNTVNKD